jgi:hypothetical protein
MERILLHVEALRFELRLFELFKVNLQFLLIGINIILITLQHSGPEMYIHLYKFTFRLWIRPLTYLREHCDILDIHNHILSLQQRRQELGREGVRKPCDVGSD